MKYLLMIYGNEAEYAKLMSAEGAFEAEIEDYNTFDAAAASRNTMIGGHALDYISSATTVRVRDGKIITTDGPFAETKEQLGGYYLLDCKDLDEAIEMAALIPGAKNGSIEIRPVVVFE